MTPADLDIWKLWKRVLELCVGYFGSPPYRWLMIEIMTDYGIRQKAIAEFIGLDHSTISYYQHRYKPIESDMNILKQLKEEF